MVFNFFKKIFPQKFLGIDIGVSSIKVVEISKWGQQRTLENYGMISAKSLFKEQFRTFDKSTLLISTDYVAKVIKAILKEAKIKTKSVIFSIPDFSTFFVNFDLPPMKKNEIPEAVRYSAMQYLPLPVHETELDWHIIKGEFDSSNRAKTKIGILLAAIPKEVVTAYQKIAEISNLQLFALESEVFSLLNSLTFTKDELLENKMVSVFDLGAQSTTINIINNKKVIKSFSLKFSSDELTFSIGKALDLPYNKSEELKIKFGILPENKKVADILYPFVDSFLQQVKNIFYQVEDNENSKIEKIFLSGGGSKLLGLDTYIEEILKKPTEILNPFENLIYPPDLNAILIDLGPIFAPAIGSALEGLNKI